MSLIGLFGLVILASLIVLTAAGGCHRVAQPRLTISAAASLRGALTEAAEAYRSGRPRISLSFNFAGSGTLEQQIIEGAPVDLFISAGTREMDALAARGLIDAASRRDLLANRLVLVAAASAAAPAAAKSPLQGWPDLAAPAVRRVAMGFPETVPAGEYGKQVLESLGLWAGLQGKLILAKDVTQVVTYVKTGDVDAGIVYASDARDPALRVVAEAPPGSHSPIVYPAAVVKSSRQQRASREFLSFLSEPEGQAIFAKYGFTAKPD
ncbi:MAG TPA: molybdate ABC transporter substrate-binding protein [Bacillota bacterium]